jgi:hypothetical protein
MYYATSGVESAPRVNFITIFGDFQQNMAFFFETNVKPTFSSRTSSILLENFFGNDREIECAAGKTFRVPDAECPPRQNWGRFCKTFYSRMNTHKQYLPLWPPNRLQH